MKTSQTITDAWNKWTEIDRSSAMATFLLSMDHEGLWRCSLSWYRYCKANIGESINQTTAADAILNAIQNGISK